jgi:cytochrome c oxidase subunit 4
MSEPTPSVAVEAPGAAAVTTAHPGHPGAEAPGHARGERAHPPDIVYIIVALVLAALTMLEVGIYYLKGGAINTAALLVLMVLKFSIVVLFFMHLRFDSRVFRRLFVTGLFLAAGVYTIVLFTFGVFHV